MKNRIILMAAAVAAMMVSCQKEDISTPVANTEPMVITAGVETKTSLGEDGKTVNWASTDIIAVFDINNVKNDFSATSVSGASATFAGSVTTGTTQFYAVYPSNLAKSVSEGVLSVTIPTEQTPAAGTFAEEHNISVAKGVRPLGDGSQFESVVAFKNVCALLKFTVPTFVGTVKKVTVNNENVIAGDMEVDYSRDVPECSISSGDTSVSMSGEFAAGSTFYFVVAPTSLKNVSVTVVTLNNGTFSMQVAEGSTTDLFAGQYKNLGTLKLAASVDATHRTDADGNLNGTKLQIELPDAADKIESMTLNVISASGAINWSNITSLDWDGVVRNEDYPYLPQGSYTLSGSYKLKTGTIVTLGNTSFEVEAPDFVIVTQSKSYTSYTKYKSEGADAGNMLSGLTLYALKNGVSANISQDLYDKYGACEITTEVDGATVNGDDKVYGANELGGKSVVNCVTFAGHKFSSTAKVYDITGIPLTAAPPKEGSSLWSCNNTAGDILVQWETEYVKIASYMTTGYIKSPQFYSPKNDDLSVSLNVVAKLQGMGTRAWVPFVGYTAYKYYNSEINCELNGAAIAQMTLKTNNIPNDKFSSLSGEDWTEYDKTSTISLAKGESNIIIRNNGVSYLIGSVPDLRVYSVVLKYN